jgi:hypothetical protein
MIFTEELIHNKIEENQYATLVTMGNNKLSSRTMTYGFLSSTGIFMLTHKGSNKLEDLANHPEGILHIVKIEDEVTQSYDISIYGRIERCESSSPDYEVGIRILGKNNPQVLYLLNSDAKEDFELLLFRIIEINGSTYYQSISGIPKTTIKGCI